MNYKELIERKAEQYAAERIQGKDKNIQPYNDIYFSAKDGFAAGAEAMREMANTWIPIMAKLPPANVELLAKRKDRRGLFVYNFNKDDIDSGLIGLLNITHWKPIII